MKNRKFIYSDTQSLDGFKEMLERLLELKKISKIKYNPEGFNEFNLEMIYSYREDESNNTQYIVIKNGPRNKQPEFLD